MSFDRRTARIVVPPILALGLVAVLVNPLAAASPADQVMAGTGGTVHAAAPAYLPDSRTASPNPAGMVVVGIPAVAFTADVAVRHGRLQAPVLLTDPSVSGRAHVVGAVTGTGCTADLAQGAPVVLDCVITAVGSSPRIVVTLSDGRTAVKAITLG